MILETTVGKVKGFDLFVRKARREGVGWEADVREIPGRAGFGLTPEQAVEDYLSTIKSLKASVPRVPSAEDLAQ